MHMKKRWRFAAVVVLTGVLELAASAQSNVQLTGAGSTFVYPIMTHWVEDYQQKRPGVRINYQSIGSGGGIQQLKNGLVDFGASDVALTDDQLKQMPKPIVQIPESAGPVCITYNLPDLKKPLRLSGEALAAIYLGTVTQWSDPAIAKTNPGVKLPDQPITVVHRSDGSGTTGIFTTYLSAVNAEWKRKVGEGISVSWPVGLGGKGSEGVTGFVKQMPAAIGYVELNYAEENHLPVVEVQNQAGAFVTPTSASASAAIAAFHEQLAHDVRTPIVNPPASAPNAYPISGLTFLLVTRDGGDTAKRAATRDFIEYVITEGQSIADRLHYAALPPSIETVDHSLVGELEANGKPLALKR